LKFEPLNDQAFQERLAREMSAATAGLNPYSADHPDGRRCHDAEDILFGPRIRYPSPRGQGILRRCRSRRLGHPEVETVGLNGSALGLAVRTGGGERVTFLRRAPLQHALQHHQLEA
jgi:hypothetical protein